MDIEEIDRQRMADVAELDRVLGEHHVLSEKINFLRLRIEARAAVLDAHERLRRFDDVGDG